MPDAIVFKPTKQPPRCRNCSYRLEGLTESRCPECGRGFDPADVRTYSDDLSIMPPWNGSCWFLGWLAALAMGVVATALIVMLFEPDIREVAWLIQRGPVEFAFLSLPAIGLIRIGFTCRLAKTIAWSAGVTFVAVSIGVIALGAMRSFFEACLVVLSVVSVVALLLSLGHAFRRWGPFEWFRGNRVQNQSQMHGGGRR